MLKFYDRLRGMRKYLLFFCDMAIWNISFYFAFSLDKNTFSLEGNEATFFYGLIILNICFSFIFIVFKLHNKIWRYANLEDFFYAGLASVSANFLFCMAILLIGMHLGVKTFLLQAIFSIFIMLLCRFIYRLDKILQRRNTGEPHQRLLMVGGGEASVLMLNEFAKSSGNNYLPVCIIDDDLEKIGRTVCGLKIVGTTYEIRSEEHTSELQSH